MFDIGIIGGGLAGLLTCRALLSSGIAGREMVVIDAGDRFRGSDNPGAMMHAFPGRLLKPKPGLLDAYLASSALLDEIVELEGVPSFRGPMIRPLLEGDVGEAFEESWRAHRGDYPKRIDDERIGAERIQELGPFSDEIRAAIVYEPAYSVDLAAWLAHLRDELRSSGVDFLEAHVESIERRPTSWKINLGDAAIGAGRCVLATGPAMAEWFPELNIQPTGGALLVVDARGRELGAAVSAGGHIAPLGDGRWVAGATWWHDDEFETIDDEAAGDAVVERVRHLIPSIADLPRIATWRGVRAVHANDRRPLVGEVHGQTGLFVCGAFGSKGLLWAPMMTDALAALICDGETPPNFADAGRLGRRWWRPGTALRL
ncbi:MAG: NAD(P)/FAD-dependent oxidoreductase [Myxococcota bacterium]